jgi:hydroxymethylbilane synthase
MTGPPATPVLRLGTRGSKLARAQTRVVIERLRGVRPECNAEERIVHTQGDQDAATPLPAIGGKGVFTEALERALLAGEVDAAVHSLKDLPVAPDSRTVLGAICCREDARDVLVSRDGASLAALPQGSIVGTSSTRRAAQVLAARPDLRTRAIRGNVETRIAKVRAGEFAATVLARAGMVRLGMEQEIAEVLSFDTFLPAPGQGALAVQCRANDGSTRAWLQQIDDAHARACTEAERAFLRALGGGCSVPIAAHAECTPDGEVTLQGQVIARDGTRSVRVSGRAPAARADELGRVLALEALRQGAARLLR